MVAVVAPDLVPLAIAALSARGVAATLIGEVVPAGALDGRRYAEGALEMLGSA
jgi:hypothetical protein